MSNTFKASIIATAFALASVNAAPVQAGMSDLEKFLLGAGALIIIGTAAEHQARAGKSDRKGDRVELPYESKPKPHHKAQNSHKGRKAKHRKAALPGYCLRKVHSHEGKRRIFGARCLQNNYAQVDSLPNRCRTYVDGPRGTRFGYRPKCLRRAGYTVAGR